MGTDRSAAARAHAPADVEAPEIPAAEAGGARNPSRVPSRVARLGDATTKGSSVTRCLVLGGTGFVGSAIAERLQSLQPDWDVRATSVEELDVTKLDSMRRTFRPGDIVVNSSGYANATDRSPRGAALHQAVNAEGARNVANAARAAGAAKVVHISSVAAQGAIEGTDLTEDDRGEVSSPYAASKRLGEELFQSEIGDVDFWILRPTSIFGENRGLTSTFVQLSRIPLLPLPRNGRTLVPLCHVDNIAHAVSLAAMTDRPGRATITCGDVRSHAIGDVLKLLARLQGRTIQIVSLSPRMFRLMTPLANLPFTLLRRPPLLDETRIATLTHDVEFNVSRAVHRLGYTPIVSLDQGIERVVAASRSQERRP